MKIRLNKTLGSSLLVAGTAIGAGMLALPVVTAQGGMFYSSMIYIVCWLFSLCTGLLFVEICYWMPKDANIVSMAHHLLGPIGKIVAWVLYLFLFYSLSIAYASGGGEFVVSLTNGHMPLWLGVLIFTVVFALFVYLGTSAVDRVNSLLMVGLIVSFVLFFALGISKVNFSFLTKGSFKYAVFALPVMFTSFSYQGIIPSLNSYLDGDAAQMKKTLFFGTLIPLCAYFIWEFLILGIIPLEGKQSLLNAKQQGLSAVQPLSFVMSSKVIPMLGQFFAFFALTTSFLGVTLGLRDFLADSLQVEKSRLNRLWICALIYLPPGLIACTCPGVFLKALGYAGGIGCVLLLGLLPTLMVWVGRYKKKFTRLGQQLPGGRWVLSALIIFVIFELVIEILNELC